MKTIRVVAAVVDTRKLTLYKEDGTTIEISQGDPRLRKIIEVAAPHLEAHGYADVDITPEFDNSYAEFEQKSSVVRFFRVAKAKLKELLDLVESVEPVDPVEIGNVPVATAAPATPVSVATAPVQDDQAETFAPVVQVPEVKATQTMSAVDEIIAHAIPVASENFNETGLVKQRPMAIEGTTSKDHPDDSATDTIIAVVNDKVIPNVELIKSQFARAANMGSTQGVDNFLKRLASVIEKRQHSVEDLLKFMERADLPIADDGSIIIYKVLRRSGDQYVDCHSKKVQQWIGAYVCMDPSLVDHNRRNECSNGLHVARRGYISQFSGDVCVLAKLAPEDVITVPSYDANKMRVCGYHILEELPAKLYALLNQNRPITEDADGKTMLAAAMCGKHTRKTHEVRITASYGGGVQVKDIPEDVSPPPILTPDAPTEVEALSEVREEVDAPIEPSQLAEVQKASLTRAEKAQQLYDAWSSASDVEKPVRLAELLAFKKSAKVGWDRLGISDPTTKLETKAETIKSPVVKKKAEVIKAPPKKIALPDASEGSPKERIKQLLEIGLGSAGVAQKVYDIKKASKKGWDALGVNDDTSHRILKIIGKD
jgi:hypothetical protein